MILATILLATSCMFGTIACAAYVWWQERKRKASEAAAVRPSPADVPITIVFLDRTAGGEERYDLPAKVGRRLWSSVARRAGRPVSAVG